MKTREEILLALGEAKRRLASSYPIRDLWLFGSYSRGDQTAESDVDVLVDVGSDIGIRFVEFADCLERELEMPVHVVSRRAVETAHWDAIAGDLIHV